MTRRGRPRKAAPELYWLESKSQYAVNLHGKRKLLGPDKDAAEMRRAELLLKARAERTTTVEDVLAVPARDRSVAEVLLIYRRKLRPSMDETHVRRIDRAIGLVVDRYGDLPACEFSSLHLDEVRRLLANEGKARGYCNAIVQVVKTAWRWCLVSNLVTGGNASSVLALRAWEEDDGGRETLPRLPVDDATVAKTLPHLPTLIQAAVRLLQLTGARPKELCKMRRGDISTRRDEQVEPLPGWRIGAPTFESVTIWLYAVPRHKTRRKKKARIIALGPKAQAVLGPLLEGLGPEEHVFSPVRSEAIRSAERRAARECPVYESQDARRRARKPDHPRRPPGSQYTTESLGKVLSRACAAAGTDWTLYQLRHRAGVLVADQFDESDAAELLGHSPGSNATGGYTRARLGRLAELAAKVG